MAFTREEIAAAGRMIEAGMAGGMLAPGMEAASAREREIVPIPLARMLGEPEEVSVGNLRLLVRPLSQGEMRRQFWPLAARLPFFDAALNTDGPGIDFEAMALQAKDLGIEVSAALIARQFSVLQQSGDTLWLLCEVVALMLVDDGTGPAWPHLAPGEEPGEDATEETRTAWLALADSPAPDGRVWLDDGLDELSIGEWCDLLRGLLEVNAGFKRTARSFAMPAPEG